MAEPGFDDVEFDALFQKVHGAGMAQTMRRKFFSPQTLAPLCGGPKILFDDGPHAESGKPRPSLTDKENVLPRQFRLPAVQLQIGLDRFNGGGPQREGSFLAAFAPDGHQLFGEVEPAHPGIGRFLAPSAGIVEVCQEGQVSESIGSTGIDTGKKNLELLVGEVVECAGGRFFHRDRPDLHSLTFEARPLPGHMLKERPNGSQPVVARRDGIAAALGSILQVFKEIEDEWDVQIRQFDMWRAFLPASEFQKELEGVSIAFEGMRAGPPLFNEVGDEKSLQGSFDVSGFHVSLRPDE